MKTLINYAVLAALASAEAPKGAGGAAVQNTKTMDDATHLKGKTMGEVVNELDKSDLRKSYKAIDDAYDIYWGKDGIDDTTQKLNSLQGKVGERVYDVLKLAMEHCEGRLPIVKAYFAALCKRAEEYLMSRYIKEHKEEKPLSEIVPLWPQYKTSFLKGLDMGLSPDDKIEDTDAPRWPTAAKFRTEVQKREKEAKGANERNNGERNSSGQTATQLQLVTKGWSPKLSAAMEVMCKALNELSHEHQDKFAGKILDIASEITTYANTLRREVTGDTRTAAQKAAGPETTEELDPGTKAAMQAALDRDTDKEESASSQQETTAKGNKRKGARAA